MMYIVLSNYWRDYEADGDRVTTFTEHETLEEAKAARDHVLSYYKSGFSGRSSNDPQSVILQTVQEVEAESER